MDAKTSRAFEAIRECIDRECDPDLMTRSQYRDLLEELAGDVESRLEAVQEELGEDEDDSG